MSPTYRCWGPVLAIHKAVLAVEVIILWKLREKYTGFCLQSANWTHTLARQMQWVGIRNTRHLGLRMWTWISAGVGNGKREVRLSPWLLIPGGYFTQGLLYVCLSQSTYGRTLAHLSEFTLGVLQSLTSLRIIVWLPSLLCSPASGHPMSV